MNTPSLVKNFPNASRLIDSLRHLDYENVTAVADIVDNAIDANATQIWVTFIPHKDKKAANTETASIIISDNGSGMTLDVLDEALKLGSDVEKNPSCDLGLYGMGLVTASISFGTKLEVVTKTTDGQCLRSFQDLDLIYKENDFVKILEGADSKAEKTFDRYVIDYQKKFPLKERSGQQSPIRNSGTVVIISNIDNCQWKTIKGFSDKLLLHSGQTYRKFLKAGNNRIYIQGQAVTPIDPIDDYKPSTLIEDEIKLPDGSIKLKIVELNDYGTAINKEKGINIPNQGFYVIRNNREILAAETLGIFSKHNDYNLLRIEFSYPGTLDKILSSNFSKRRIVLNQSIGDKVAKICNPFIRQVRSRAKERQKSRKETQEDFSEVEKFITQKSHLLKRPKAEIEKRAPKTQQDEKQKEPIDQHSPRLNITKRKRITLDRLKAKFRLKSLGDKGPLYEVDQERDIVIIYWNEDHPFYSEFIEINADSPDILNPICFLVYCFGNAELISKPDSDSNEILENIRYDVGRNLAVLLR